MIVTRVPKSSFDLERDVEVLRPYFDAIGAADEHYDARRVVESGDFVDVGWDDAGGAMLSAFGAHLLQRTRAKRGLGATNDDGVPYAVFRGRLGEATSDGVFLLAIRANEPGPIPLAELTADERALRDRITGPDARCLCPLCALDARGSGLSPVGERALRAVRDGDLDGIERSRGRFPISDVPALTAAYDALTWTQRIELVVLVCDRVTPEVVAMSERFLREAVREHDARPFEHWSAAHASVATALSVVTRDPKSFDAWYQSVEGAMRVARTRARATESEPAARSDEARADPNELSEDGARPPRRRWGLLVLGVIAALVVVLVAYDSYERDVAARETARARAAMRDALAARTDITYVAAGDCDPYR